MMAQATYPIAEIESINPNFSPQSKDSPLTKLIKLISISLLSKYSTVSLLASDKGTFARTCVSVLTLPNTEGMKCDLPEMILR